MFQCFSSAFWYAHRFNFWGNLDLQAFRLLPPPNAEKRIRSGSVLSETTNMAAQRAVLRAALKSPAQEGLDTRRLRRVGSSCCRNHLIIHELAPKKKWSMRDLKSLSHHTHPRGHPSIHRNPWLAFSCNPWIWSAVWRYKNVSVAPYNRSRVWWVLRTHPGTWNWKFHKSFFETSLAFTNHGTRSRYKLNGNL